MHHTIADIAILADHCAKVGSLRSLSGHIQAAVQDIGFRWFSLIRMVDLQRDDKQGVIIHNYPETWFDEIVRERLYKDSAILTASARSFGGICWGKICERFPLTVRQRETLRRGRDHGLNSGFTFSMAMPGSPNAAFTVARSRSDDVNEQEKIAVRAIAAIALENGSRIISLDTATKAPNLTNRQRECTALVAQGKTDWEIGKIIGISRDTVHEYIEAARKKYDVRTRPQLVLAAYRSGELPDHELCQPG